MNPPTLFDYPVTAGRSRRRDPATSRIAAKSVDAATRKGEVVSAMRLIVTACTASEIHHRLYRDRLSGMDIGSVRSRLNQLLEDGLVRKVGVKVVPKPEGTGRPEQTWALA